MVRVGCARGIGPVDLEERAGNVGDAEVVFGEDLLCVGDLRVGEGLEALVPHGAKLDPLEAEFMGGNRTGVIKVLGYLVGDDGDLEGRHCR